MKYLIEKTYLVLFFITIFLLSTKAFCKESEIKYSRNNISNYLSGIISAKQNYTNAAFYYLNKVQSLKSRHYNYNIQFIRTLVLLGKFEEAFKFSKKIRLENESFFEVDLLLGLNYFINDDYPKAEKHFKRLNNISRYNLFPDDFLSNILLSWVKASEYNEDASFEFFNRIPDDYRSLKQIQNIFLQCYFNIPEAYEAYNNLINDKDSNFFRYNFFLANYLLHNDRNLEAHTILSPDRNLNNSNMLIRQAKNFLLAQENKKIKNFFNCKNPSDSIAEIFYIMANLYSNEKDYQLSNFYLKISLYLNNKFTPNKTLLAENYFYQKKYELSKKIYNSIKSIGPVYSWNASINLARILSITQDKEFSAIDLENEFNLLSDPNFENYYELGNFFRDNGYYEKSIKYYSLSLQNINKDHFLVSKILESRGMSYERLGDWDKAENDLMEVLKILPDQAYVLNYLAYSWTEKRINIERALEMLKRANKLKENDGYITDSIGWAYYVNENYAEARKFLQKAVEIMPRDPIINDHYADSLWMLNKKMQARYFWKYVLSLEDVEKKLKDNIDKKLIFGINEKL